VVIHFSDEEQLQNKYKYPEYSSHIELHKAFVKAFLEYKNQLDTQGTSISLVAKFNSFVSNWLIYHISREDKKIGVYIKSINV